MPTVPLYPVGLMVAHQPCLVVGGGPVAGRKIVGLLACGAAVTVVAPEAHRAVGVLAASGALATLGGPPVDVQLRPYRAGEAAAYRLAIAATGVPAVDDAVCADAVAAGVWVNRADDPDAGSCHLPAVYRDGPVAVTVSTGGSSPALARWLLRRCAAACGEAVGPLAELLSAARRTVQSRGRPTDAVDWDGLLEGPLPALVGAGRLEEARRLLDVAVDAATG